MKGFVIHKIINTLSAKEFEEYLVWVQKESKNHKFASFCSFLRENEYTEEDALRIFHAAKTKKHGLLIDLGNCLIRYIGESSQNFHIESMLEVAKRLALAMENEAAMAVLRPMAQAAAEIERYDLLVRVWKILKIMGFDPDPDAIGFALPKLSEIHHQIKTNAKLEMHLQAAIEAKTIDIPAKRVQTLIDLRKAALEEFGEGSLGQRGQYTFLKIHARIDSLLMEPTDWHLSQEAVVAQIKSHPWVCEDYEFELAQAERNLLLYYWQAGQIQKYNEGSPIFIASQFKSKRATFEKYYFQFPFLFAVAIETGDSIAGISAYRRFLEIIASEDQLPARFVTLNLYWASFFNLANKQISESAKCLIQLSKYAKPDFIPHILLLTNILEIVVAIETQEYEDATRLLKNLQRSTRKAALPSSKAALNFLKAQIRLEREILADKEMEVLKNEIQNLGEQLKGHTIMNFFDLGIWNESKQNNRPMLELFKQRAILQKQNEAQ